MHLNKNIKLTLFSCILSNAICAGVLLSTYAFLAFVSSSFWLVATCSRRCLLSLFFFFFLKRTKQKQDFSFMTVNVPRGFIFTSSSSSLKQTFFHVTSKRLPFNDIISHKHHSKQERNWRFMNSCAEAIPHSRYHSIICLFPFKVAKHP